ncbi:hypothetical protein [Streptomyces boninensis]|uniref:hypothetical protein n=1 Tax=Streptomyces boninensis TaxID=2039455 RepID=UPI003B21F8CA
MTRTPPALREIRAELPLLAGLLVLIALLAGGSAAAAPLLDRTEGRVLAARLADAQESDAAIRFSRSFRPGLDFDKNVKAPVLASDLQVIRGNLAKQRPKHLVGPLGLPTAHIALPETGARIGGRPTLLRLLHTDDAPRAPAYVAGRPPRAAGPGEPVEIAVSTRTRDALRLRPGSRIDANAPGQHLGGVYRRHGYTGPMVVSGVFRTPAARGPAALGKVRPLLAQPLRADGVVQAEALFALGSLPAVFQGGTAQFTVDWRVPLRLTGARAARYAGDDGRAGLIRGLAAYRQAGEAHIWDDIVVLNSYAVGRNLAPDVEDEATPVIRRLGGEWGQAALLSSFALAAVAAVGLATVAVVARLAVVRRAARDQLRRARGASATGLAAERALLTAPFAAAGLAAGLLAARLAVPAGTSLQMGWAVAVAAAAWLAAPALTAAGTREHRLRRAEPDTGVRRPARVRLTAEAAVLLTAVAGIVALRVRGTTSGPDPQLAAVPVLAGLAVVVVLIRLYPLPVRALARLAGRGRGAVGLIALARAAKEAPAKALALLVLVTTLGTAVFTGLVSETVTEGRRTGLDWRTGGADAVVTGLQNEGAELRAAPGVEHAVPVTGYSTGLVSDRTGLSRRTADLVAFDPGRLAAARPGAPAAGALRGLGAAERRGGRVEIPAVGSAGTAGDTYTADFKGASVHLRVVAELGRDAAADPVLGPLLRARGDAPGSSAPLLLTDARAMAAAERAGMREPGERVLLLYGERIDPAQLRALATASGVVGLRADDALIFRTEERAAGAGDVLRPAQRVSAVCGAAAALLALLAVLLELALTAPERGRTLARLRLLGFGSRPATALNALQLLPMTLAAVAGGTALGLALPAVLGPALELRDLAGTPAEPALQTDYVLTAALAAGVVALVACAVALETAAAGRRGSGATLRLGDET